MFSVEWGHQAHVLSVVLYCLYFAAGCCCCRCRRASFLRGASPYRSIHSAWQENSYRQPQASHHSWCDTLLLLTPNKGNNNNRQSVVAPALSASASACLFTRKYAHRGNHGLFAVLHLLVWRWPCLLSRCSSPHVAPQMWPPTSPILASTTDYGTLC